MLPKIETPTYELTLPIAKKKIQFRPFLVKEQKILMMTLESNDPDGNQINIKKILQNCMLSDMNVEKLSLVDIEYYMIQLRARSVGEVVESKYKCENEVDGKKCGNVMSSSLNLLEIKVKNSDVESLIKLTPKISIQMKYPEYSILNKIKSESSQTDTVFEMVASCIDYISDGDNFYYAHETPQNEIISFLESLDTKQFEKIEKFFENLPEIEKSIDIKCSKCGFDHHIVLKGIESFFV